MRKEHLDLFTFGLSLWIEGGLGGQPGKITGVLMLFAANEAGVRVRAAF